MSHPDNRRRCSCGALTVLLHGVDTRLSKAIRDELFKRDPHMAESTYRILTGAETKPTKTIVEAVVQAILNLSTAPAEPETQEEPCTRVS